MGEAAACACKGVRTCLICESSNKQGQHNNHSNSSSHSNSRELVLEFDPALGLAVGPPGSTLAGLATRVSGVHVWRDFLSAEEERQLILEIDRSEWRPSQSGRRKQDYGPKVNFRKRRVRAAGFSGLPPLGRALARRVRAAGPALLGDFVPVEQCHLEYEPSRGSSIDAHLDDTWLWGDRLVTVNLLSDTALTLTRPPEGGTRLAGGARSDRGAGHGRTHVEKNVEGDDFQGNGGGRLAMHRGAGGSPRDVNELTEGLRSLSPPGDVEEASDEVGNLRDDGEGARHEMHRPPDVEKFRDRVRNSRADGTNTTGMDLSEEFEMLNNGTVRTQLLGDTEERGGDDDGDYITLRPLSFWQQRQDDHLRQDLAPVLRSESQRDPGPRSDPESDTTPTDSSSSYPPPDSGSSPPSPGACIRVPAACVAVRVPSPRRSLVLLCGEARSAWLHAVRRSDVAARRVCVTLRELSDEFRPEPRVLAQLAEAALEPQPGTETAPARPGGGAQAEDPPAECGALRGGSSAELGAQLLATALTFRGTPVR